MKKSTLLATLASILLLAGCDDDNGGKSETCVPGCSNNMQTICNNDGTTEKITCFKGCNEITNQCNPETCTDMCTSDGKLLKCNADGSTEVITCANGCDSSQRKCINPSGCTANACAADNLIQCNVDGTLTVVPCKNGCNTATNQCSDAPVGCSGDVCTGNSYVKCVSGVPQTPVTCQYGCNTATNQCSDAPVGCSGDVCTGNSYVKCVSGVPQTPVTCQYGCNTATNQCSDAPVGCSGDVCTGNSYVKCVSGVPQTPVTCQYGCNTATNQCSDAPVGCSGDVCTGNSYVKCVSGVPQTPVTCQYGCNTATNQCSDAPNSCSGDVCSGNSYVKCISGVPQTPVICQYGCNAATNQCSDKPTGCTGDVCSGNNLLVCNKDTGTASLRECQYGCNAANNQCNTEPLCTADICADNSYVKCNNGIPDAPITCDYGCSNATQKCNPKPIPCVSDQCSGNALLVCSKDTGAFTLQDCPFGCDITQNQCNPPECDDDVCDGDHLIQCVDGVQNDIECPYGCDAGSNKCKNPPECSGNSCDGNNLILCNDGTPTIVQCKYGCDAENNSCNTLSETCEASSCSGRELILCSNSVPTMITCPYGCDASKMRCKTDICVGNSLVECDNTGTCIETPCPAGCNPAGTACNMQQCLGDYCGDFNHLFKCNADGTVTVEDCPNGCEFNACVPAAGCTANACTSDGTDLLICDKSTQTATRTPCKYGCITSKKQCVPFDVAFEGSCNPDTYTGACSEDHTKSYRCSQEGVIQETECTPGTQCIISGRNAAVCKAPQKLVTSGGSNYYDLCFPETFKPSCKTASKAHICYKEDLTNKIFVSDMNCKNNGCAVDASQEYGVFCPRCVDDAKRCKADGTGVETCINGNWADTPNNTCALGCDEKTNQCIECTSPLCQGDDLISCDENGNSITIPCQYGCNENLNECNSSATCRQHCDGKTLISCSDDDSEYAITCSYGCSAGQCILPSSSCTDTHCSGSDLVSCNKDGSSIIVPCPLGCDADQKVCISTEISGECTSSAYEGACSADLTTAYRCNKTTIEASPCAEGEYCTKGSIANNANCGPRPQSIVKNGGKPNISPCDPANYIASCLNTQTAQICDNGIVRTRTCADRSCLKSSGLPYGVYCPKAATVLDETPVLITEEVLDHTKNPNNASGAACNTTTFIEFCDGNDTVVCDNGTVRRISCGSKKCLTTAAALINNVSNHALCYDSCDQLGSSMQKCEILDAYPYSELLTTYTCANSSNGLVWTKYKSEYCNSLCKNNQCETNTGCQFPDYTCKNGIAYNCMAGSNDRYVTQVSDCSKSPDGHNCYVDDSFQSAYCSQ